MPIPNWLLVVIVIVAVLAVGMLRERLRGSGVDAWAKTNGFRVRSPFVLDDRVPAKALSLQFARRGARTWGAGVEGTVGVVPVTIAEHLVSGETNRSPDVWFTLAMWPVGHDAAPGPVAGWTGEGQLAIDQGFAGWRMKGLLTPDQLKTMAEQLPVAMRACEAPAQVTPAPSPAEATS